MKPLLTFIIPCYNDAQTITTVVNGCFAVAEKLRVRAAVTVLNDGSTDRSARVLASLPDVTVMSHRKNMGYGRTMRDLYASVTTPWLVSIPGDYQINPKELVSLWRNRRRADMIIGWRKLRRDSPARLRQSGIYNMLLRLLFRIGLHDANSVRLMRRTVFKKISLRFTSAFVDAELAIRAARRGFRVIEVPIRHRARPHEGAGGGKLTTILPTIRDMVTCALYDPRL